MGLSQNAFQGTMIWSPFIAKERLVVLLEIATVGNVQKWWHHFLLGTIMKSSDGQWSLTFQITSLPCP
jgi:hypothetical protein